MNGIIDKIDSYLEEDHDDMYRNWRYKQIDTDWEEKTISTAERDRRRKIEDDKLKEKMKKKGMKIKESIDESKDSKKEAKKNLNGLKAKLKKYPDMPEDIQAAIKELIAFYEKELKTFTYDDVFPKDYNHEESEDTSKMDSLTWQDKWHRKNKKSKDK